MEEVYKEENYNLEKEEFPPDTDLKIQIKEGQENNEIKKFHNNNIEEKIFKEKNNEKEIILENQNNEQFQEKDDNKEEQQNEINDEIQIKKENILNHFNVKNSEKGNNINIQEEVKYIITENSKVFELIKSKDGNLVYQQVTPYKQNQIIQNYQDNQILNQIQGYPITQQNQVNELSQREQVINFSQRGQEYQVYQIPKEYHTVQQNQKYQYILQNQNNQISDKAQVYQYSQQKQICPFVQAIQDYQYLNTYNQDNQNTQESQLNEIIQQIQQNVNSQKFINNKYFQTEQQNQVYQFLGQPYIYNEEQNNYIPVYLEGNEYKEMTKSNKPKIYKKYKKNVVEINDYQINKYNNEHKKLEINNNINKMSQFRKGFHQVNVTKKINNKKIIRKDSQPKDNISKNNKKSKKSKNFSFSRNNKDSFHFHLIPGFISFNDMSTKKISINSSINLEKENFSEFIEIPRKKNTNQKALYLNNGLATGSYYSRGTEEKIEDTSQTSSKVKVSKEDIINEIAKRASNKKIKNLKHIIVDKHYKVSNFQRKAIDEEQLKQFKKGKEKIYGLNKIKKEYNNIHFKSQSMNQTSLKMKTPSKKDIEGETSIIPNNLDPQIDNNENNIRLLLGISLKPMDYYSRYLLEQINKIRIDPQSFIGVIEDAKSNIVKRKYGGIIYKSKIKIALYEGEPSFNEAINYLENIDSMEKLQFCPQITAKSPQNERELNDKDDLRIKVEEMLDNGINVKSYWRDMIKDPEISFLLMIVDDNGARKGMRRRDLLNPYMKYIGISSVEINKQFVCYITLTNKLEK